MFGKLLFLFTVIPAIEIYLLFQIGDSIGGLNTFFVVIVTGIVGAAFAKSQGFETLVKIQNKLNQGGLPGNDIIHGLMIFAGGILLITPGILTDIVGLSLVAPGPRHLLFTFFKKMITSGLQNGNIHFSHFGMGQSPFVKPEDFYSQTQARSESQIDGDVIEAEFTEKP